MFIHVDGLQILSHKYIDLLLVLYPTFFSDLAVWFALGFLIVWPLLFSQKCTGQSYFRWCVMKHSTNFLHAILLRF